MRLPKDFSAFIFELTNSHLFQEKVLPAVRSVTLNLANFSEVAN